MNLLSCTQGYSVFNHLLLPDKAGLRKERFAVCWMRVQTVNVM